LPRIAYGRALTAALLLSRYVSLSLGQFHCRTATFVRAGVQHRANEIGGFLMAMMEDFWAVGQAIRRSNYH
jgi:hypothetical protein